MCEFLLASSNTDIASRSRYQKCDTHQPTTAPFESQLSSSCAFLKRPVCEMYHPKNKAPSNDSFILYTGKPPSQTAKPGLPDQTATDKPPNLCHSVFVNPCESVSRRHQGYLSMMGTALLDTFCGDYCRWCMRWYS